MFILFTYMLNCTTSNMYTLACILIILTFIWQMLLSDVTYIAFKVHIDILSVLALSGNQFHDLGITSAMLLFELLDG